jgi:hypothetical protein
VCPRCGGEMRVIGFITQPQVIKRILDHLRKRERVSRLAPALPAASGLSRLRSAPKEHGGGQKKEKVSARDVAPSLHEPLRPHPHPRAMRQLVARPPGEPPLRPQPPARSAAAGRAPGAPKCKFLSLYPPGPRRRPRARHSSPRSRSSGAGRRGGSGRRAGRRSRRHPSCPWTRSGRGMSPRSPAPP